MFSPPFTLQKVILLAVLLAAAWAYGIWQLRGQWVRYRRKREVMAEGGFVSSRRGRDRRTVFTIVLIGAMLLVAAFSVYVDQYGTPLARARLNGVEARVDVFMKSLMGVAIGLLVLLLVLSRWNRDPALRAAAKLALAGRHAEAEAVIRRQIEAKGPNERRLTLLGLLLMDQNRLEESLLQLQEAQRLSKRPATAKNNCATALWKLGRREEAAQLFDEVCGQEPKNIVAACNSCLILAELGHETRAFERLQQAERIFERYDIRYTKHWVPLLDECRNAVPPAHGFPVILPRLEAAREEDGHT